MRKLPDVHDSRSLREIPIKYPMYSVYKIPFMDRMFRKSYYLELSLIFCISYDIPGTTSPNHRQLKFFPLNSEYE